MRLKTLQRSEGAHEDSIWAVKWIKDKGLITGSVDEMCKIWSLKSDSELGKPVTLRNQELGVVSVGINSTSQIAATSTLDCCIRVFYLETYAQIANLNLLGPENWSLAFNPVAETQLAVAAGSRGGVRLYNVGQVEDENKREICHLEAKEMHKNKIETAEKSQFALGVAYSPDGRHVFSSHMDGQIAMFDVEKQTEMVSYVGHNKAVRSLCITPDGKFMITASDDKTCNLYEIGNKHPIGCFNGHDSSVLCVESSRSGLYCMTGSSDHKIKVWDVRSTQCIQTIAEHRDAVWALSYDPDRNLLASVSDDASICIHSSTETDS